MKFVNSKRPVDYAEELYEIQKEKAELRKRLKALETSERQLSSFITKFSKGESFTFNSGRYQKCVRIGNHQRMILDEAECKRLLKSRTPYRPIDYTTVKVDFVYEG